MEHRLGRTLRVFLVLLAAAVWMVPPDRTLLGFSTSVLGLSAVLVAICWWKGEPPSWSWGRE